MWPRRGRDGAEAEAERRLEAERVDRAWADWEQRWNRPEAERIARARRSDESPVFGIGEPGAGSRTRGDVSQQADDPGGVGPRREATALAQERSELLGDVAALRDEVEALECRCRDQVRALDDEEAAVTDLRAERRRLTAEIDGNRAEVEAQQRRLSDGLDAQRLEVEEQRRRLVDALEADRSGVLSARRLQQEASARLEQEVSALEGQRSELLESVRVAALSAEHARSAERQALSRLETAKEHARKWEAEHTEVWISLDEEISALEHRFDHLGGSGAERA